MDPVLPFRALSPGTRNPKSSQQRNRDTKLSLKTRKVSTAGHDGKENRAPLTQRNFKKSNFRLSDSELITSDESDSSDLDVGTDKRQQSVMTLNSQESTFSLPVAESTRCELPARNKIGHVESTMASLHTALNGSSSSSGAEYHTACPFPTGCDESIICISDSSPESVKKTVKKTNIISESVLLTSDESECQSPPKSTKKNIFSSLRKCEEKRKLYDTVILESTDEEDCSVSVGDYRNCDIVIPPSVKSVNSPCSSLVSSTNSHLGIDGKVIPPSPERYSESSANGSLISEDGDKNTSRLHKIKVSKDRSSPLYLEANERKQCAQYFDIGQSQECPKEPDLTSSSWKDDFRLVMEESTDGSKDKSDCKDRSLKESSQKKVTGSISKEKYNDIARWLISGGNSESESDGSALCDKRLPKHQVGNVPDVSSPRESRFPARKTCSSGSESDDNFEALMASIRKKQNDDERKTSNRGNSSRNDSFIDDGVASDVVDSPSFNIYHSDLTKSIKAEIKHVKKSVKSVTQKKLFGYEDDTEEDQNTPIKDKPKKVVRNQLDSLRKVGPSNVEPHESKPICKTSKKAQVLKTDTSDSSDSKSPLSHKVSVNRKMRLKKSVKRFNSVESSESDVSSSEDPVQSKTPLWRNIKAGIGSDGSGSTSSSKLNLPKSKPKDTSKITANVPKSITQLKTPKNIAALKSPQTPYSPIRTFLSSLSGPTHEPGVRDHPEAVTYNENFKAKKEELTRRLFKLFNREVFDRRLPDDMVLEWNARLVRTAGLCYCKLIRKGGVTSRTTKIDLSTKVITSPDRLRDTLIHEMCHAAVWLLNNVSGGHGPFWKAWAHKAMKRFPELPCIERCHSYNIETKYTYRCSKCGYSFGRHSKSLDLDKKRCGYCYGTFEVFLSSKVGPNTKEKDLKTPKAPSAFALFVKENYGLVKQDHSSFKHGDIMKKLGEKFAQMKVKQSAS